MDIKITFCNLASFAFIPFTCDAMDQAKIIQSEKREYLWVVLSFLLSLAWLIGQHHWWGKYSFPFGSQLTLEAGKFGRQIASGNWSEFVQHLKFCNYYPPLYEVSLGITHALLSFRLGNVLLFNSMLCLFGAWLCYLFVRKHTDSFAASIAYLFFLSNALVFNLARIPIRELAVMVVTAWLIVVLSNNEIIKRPRRAALFTLVFSVGMMSKWTFLHFSFLPVVVVLLVQLVRQWRNKDENKRTVFLSLGLILLLGFALLAPWHLGVLDFEYLWQSAANDPEMETHFERLSFYLSKVGMGTVGGNLITAIFFLLAGLAVIFRRWQTLVPVLCLISGFVFLSFIIHREARYVLSALPPLIILAGMVFYYVPKKIYLRLPVYILILAAGIWNFYAISFSSPQLPHASGELSPIPDTACLQEGKQLIDDIVRLAAERKNGDHQAELAWHSLNMNVLPFNHDLFHFTIWQLDLENKVHFAGFDLTQYTRFIEKLPLLDVLVVADNVWEYPQEEIEILMNAYLDFRNADREMAKIWVDDPRQQRRISELFEEVKTVQTPCFSNVHVYLRNSEEDEVAE